MKTRHNELEAYVTKDGSLIRELMHPAVHGARHGCAAQSLAEAEIPPGTATAAHRHERTEEIYHVTQGRGRMHLGDVAFGVEQGDTVCIPPGTVHHVENTGGVPLKILCCCAPAYSHADTLLENAPGS